jgi:hypothetical protein
MLLYMQGDSVPPAAEMRHNRLIGAAKRVKNLEMGIPIEK